MNLLSININIIWYLIIFTLYLMTRVEKGAIIFGLGTAVMFGIYSVMKPRIAGAASNQ